MADFQRLEEAQALQEIRDTQALAFLRQRLQQLLNSARSPQRPSTASWAGELAFEAGRAAAALELMQWIDTCLKRQSK